MFVSAKQGFIYIVIIYRGRKAESVDRQTTTTVSAAWLYSASRHWSIAWASIGASKLMGLERIALSQQIRGGEHITTQRFVAKHFGQTFPAYRNNRSCVCRCPNIDRFKPCGQKIFYCGCAY